LNTVNQMNRQLTDEEQSMLTRLRGLLFYRRHYQLLKAKMGAFFAGSLAEHMLHIINNELLAIDAKIDMAAALQILKK
jgi:hypothetical protein